MFNLTKRKTMNEEKQLKGSRHSRGGRPRLPEHEKRIVRVTTQCSIAEADELMAAAERAGLKVAEWLRVAGLGQHIKSIPAINRAAYSELSRLAGNLNQLLVAAHKSGSVPLQQLSTILSATRAEVQKLRLELLGKGPET
jgi:hypothetical protein